MNHPAPQIEPEQHGTPYVQDFAFPDIYALLQDMRTHTHRVYDLLDQYPDIPNAGFIRSLTDTLAGLCYIMDPLLEQQGFSESEFQQVRMHLMQSHEVCEQYECDIERLTEQLLEMEKHYHLLQQDYANTCQQLESVLSSLDRSLES